LGVEKKIEQIKETVKKQTEIEPEVYKKAFESLEEDQELTEAMIEEA
jgi:hypothetical protein